MSTGRSIALKLTLVITLCSSFIFALILGYNYLSFRDLLQQELESNARNLTLASVNRVETVLTAVTRGTEAMARSLEHGQISQAHLLRQLRATIQETPEICASGVAYEPLQPHAARPYAPFFRRHKADILYEPEKSLSYLKQDWYQISREMQKTEWTEPYYKEIQGSILTATCSAPFYATEQGKRRLKGVVVSDVSLEWLTELVASLKVLESGYAFLISRNGTIVTHPDRSMIMNETIFSLAEARNDSTLRELGRKMIKGETGFVKHTDVKGVRSWLYYAPLPSVGWTLAVVFPEAELFARVRTLSLTVGIIGLAGIIMLAMAVVLIARSITTPLQLLAGATTAIAHGDFDAELPVVHSRDEVGTLAHAFGVMKDSLKEHIKKLTETTAAKERIESELNIAHTIQMDFLPKVFPPFPDRQEFDLFALMEPAKEVGGDFYDFFLVDETHLCFVIADVSGKGVPAALFMAMSMTLIKATARDGHTPDEILTRVNNELSRENNSCMFVTTFCAILDTASGEVTYANGGHNSPLHLKHDGTIVWLPSLGGLMVGAMEGAPYRCERLHMEPGDSLFLYTDGVTEAMNSQEQFFGDERMERDMYSLHRSSVKDAVNGIMADVLLFAGDAPQSDDITMLMIQYRGK